MTEAKPSPKQVCDNPIRMKAQIYNKKNKSKQHYAKKLRVIHDITACQKCHSRQYYREFPLCDNPYIHNKVSQGLFM